MAPRSGLWAGWLAWLTVAFLACLSLAGCAPAATVTPPPPTPRQGQIEVVDDGVGSHVRYLPMSSGGSPPIVVLVQGTPAEDEAVDTARYYVEHWQPWAEAHGVLLIAPAFDKANFGSKHPDLVGGGYRGLFGREIGADEWVIQLVDAYQAQVGSDEDRFFLYGHSAGGWFVSRFLMTHPEQIRGAVITASVTYPHPNPDVPWPYGLGPVEATLHWSDPPAETEVAFYPKLTWQIHKTVRFHYFAEIGNSVWSRTDVDARSEIARNKPVVRHKELKFHQNFSGHLRKRQSIY